MTSHDIEIGELRSITIGRALPTITPEGLVGLPARKAEDSEPIEILKHDTKLPIYLSFQSRSTEDCYRIYLRAKDAAELAGGLQLIGEPEAELISSLTMRCGGLGGD